jgi:hypothetical protein
VGVSLQLGVVVSDSEQIRRQGGPKGKPSSAYQAPGRARGS